MSVNLRDKDTGDLVTLASGTRMWVGTRAAHLAAVNAGTMPNNVMVCLTDDYEVALEGVTYGLNNFVSLTDEEGEDLDKPLEIYRSGRMLSIGGSFRLTKDMSDQQTYIYPVYNIGADDIHKVVGGTVPIRGYVSGGEDIRPWFYSSDTGTVGIGISPSEALVENAVIFIGGTAMIEE